MVNPVLYIVSGIPVASLAVLSFLVMRKLESNKEKAMVSFQLQENVSIRDFQLLALAGLPFITGGVIYFLGGFMESSLLKNIGYSFGLPTAFTMLYVVYRWWRRF